MITSNNILRGDNSGIEFFIFVNNLPRKSQELYGVDNDKSNCEILILFQMVFNG